MSIGAGHELPRDTAASLESQTPPDPHVWLWVVSNGARASALFNFTVVCLRQLP